MPKIDGITIERVGDYKYHGTAFSGRLVVAKCSEAQGWSDRAIALIKERYSVVKVLQIYPDVVCRVK